MINRETETSETAEDRERRADEALASIFALEALHEAIKDRLSHLITLAELCHEQFLRSLLNDSGDQPNLCLQMPSRWALRRRSPGGVTQKCSIS